jgi:hypothetical protein
MTRKHARATKTGVDPRVARWAEQVLERASGHLDAVEDLTAEITRHADALAAEKVIPSPRLIEQVVSACHAAIALVLVTDYRRAVLLDPADAADPAKTVTAVAKVFADFPKEIRPHLAHSAAVKVAVYSAAVD